MIQEHTTDSGIPMPRHLNQGPLITPRLERLLQIIGQQGAVRFDQIQYWLARLSPEPHRMKEPDKLSTERTRKFLRPWVQQEQLLMYKGFYARQPGWLWLTQKGYKYIDLNLRYYEPSPASLDHLHALNDIRLFIEARRPQDTWRSERQLRAEQNASKKGSTLPHRPDAELMSLEGRVVAIECELTLKSEKRLEEIVFDLAAQRRYPVIWYFAPEQVASAVKKAVHKLPPEHHKRFMFYNLKGERYHAE